MEMCEISPLWFPNAFLNRLIEDMLSHISCIRVIFSDVCFHMCSQISFWPDAKSQKLQMCKNFWIMISKRLLKSSAWTDVKSHKLHVCKETQMLYYTSPLKSPAWTVTIVADVRNFSIMISKRLLKLPDWRYAIIQCHISCMCVIFLNVYFHMCSQIACLNRCKVTIVTIE